MRVGRFQGCQTSVEIRRNTKKPTVTSRFNYVSDQAIRFKENAHFEESEDFDEPPSVR